MRRFMNFVAGAFCGALAGSVVALLITPASGDQLRLRATSRLGSLRDEMSDAYRMRRAQLEAELESMRQGEG
jgi:gas vesicle protein